MLQFSPPAQAGATAAARINSASRMWIHWVATDFIATYYRNIACCMSTGKTKERRTSTETKSEIRSTKLETNWNAQAVELVDTLIEIIKSKFVSAEGVLISGFDKFCVKEKREMRGRNPAAGDSMLLAARRLAVFKCSGGLRDRINKSQ
jgi:integration host factor subunit alpha